MNTLLILLVSSMAQAQVCISKPQAQNVALKVAQARFCQSSQYESEQDAEACDFAISQVKNKIWFHPQFKRWSVTLKEYECAQGASCWEGVHIGCRGETTYFHGGED
jgi:hypothetical protein